MARDDEGRLRRALHPMPKAVRDALEERALLSAYQSRPPYQRNDYLGWIARAKLEPTRQKRLSQMLDELARGDVYMKMRWSAGTRRARPGRGSPPSADSGPRPPQRSRGRLERS